MVATLKLYITHTLLRDYIRVHTFFELISAERQIISAALKIKKKGVLTFSYVQQKNKIMHPFMKRFQKNLAKICLLLNMLKHGIDISILPSIHKKELLLIDLQNIFLQPVVA